MGFTGITLVLVSLAFFGSTAAHDCQNGTRPESQNDREGCDFYCWTIDQFMGPIFLHRRCRCFYNKWGRIEYVKNGECHLTSDTGGPYKVNE
uniref:Putative basic tail protein n=1 Tax=Ixodes ricinus TaxID=34613 RepID=A0A0K8RDQ7_IXORI